jgi:hypothetical protein
MRRLALIATVLIGASSGAAYAWPFSGNVNGKIIIHTDNDRGDRYDHHHDRYGRGAYQARRWDRARFRAHQNEWMTIGDHLSAESNRQFINLNYAPVSQLVVQAERGAPLIVQVAIDYGPGAGTQVVKLNQQLGRFGNDSQVIDLNGRGRAVNRVIVYTDPRFGGAYSVLAR